MFWKKKKVLKEEIVALKEELANLELKKKIEQEDIRHLVRINEERQKFELEREKLKLENISNAEIKAIRDDYRIKIEKRLEIEVDRTKEMYVEILQRLPNINVALKGAVK